MQKQIKSRVRLTHCYGHALQLAVGDTIKTIKIIRGTLEAAFELNKLKKIEYSMILNLQKKNQILS